MTDEHNVSVYAGPYANTTRVKHLLTTDGGDAVPAELVRAIDVEADPELFGELSAGTLHQVTGPRGTVHDLAVPVVCHDPTRRVLALVVPTALRWDEFRLRKELMDEMTAAAVELPAYARHFHSIIGADGFEALQGASEVLTESDITQLSSRPQEDLAVSKDLARKRADLETEAERVRVEREQLTEVRERFDREREQLDQFAEEIAASRQELEQLREALDIERRDLNRQRLNQEGQILQAQSGASQVPEEATQVVTDDQFIEVVDVSDIELAAADSVVQLDVDEVVIAEIEADVPDNMNELVASTRHAAVKIINDRVLAMAQVDPERAARVVDGNPTFFVQLHEIDGYPLVSLLLASLDERDQIVEGFGWSLDPAPDGDRLVLERLRDRTKLRAAFYGPTGRRVRAVEIAAPFSTNVAWILERANELLKKPGRVKYPEAREKFDAGLPRLGTMRHNFTRESFAEATSTSEVKLAAGIVGYWSKSDTFQYLIANRCFPLEHFRSIQRRVTRRAAEAGIFINRPLRRVALELGLADDERSLVELLIANFAETSISIRANNLESADQWDNWDALLGLGEEMGIPPDPDVVELAEVSLKRAQEAEELADKRQDGDETHTIEDDRKAESPHESLVIAKRSESTGITYFLPNNAVLDTFDDLASMSREDLELLLNDANGRLEAAQMLIERFGASGTPAALEAAEKMNAAQVAALALFIESKAGGLEAELVRCIESGGPSATYVAARGLAAVKSTSAIPALIDALIDDQRETDRPRFAEAIAEYGEKLLPALTRAIKRDGPNDHLILLLSALEDRQAGTLSTLSKDRSKNLREAARLARQQRESQTA